MALIILSKMKRDKKGRQQDKWFQKQSVAAAVLAHSFAHKNV